MSESESRVYEQTGREVLEELGGDSLTLSVLAIDTETREGADGLLERLEQLPDSTAAERRALMVDLLEAGIGVFTTVGGVEVEIVPVKVAEGGDPAGDREPRLPRPSSGGDHIWPDEAYPGQQRDSILGDFIEAEGDV